MSPSVRKVFVNNSKRKDERNYKQNLEHARTHSSENEHTLSTTSYFSQYETTDVTVVSQTCGDNTNYPNEDLPARTSELNDESEQDNNDDGPLTDTSYEIYDTNDRSTVRYFEPRLAKRRRNQSSFEPKLVPVPDINNPIVFPAVPPPPPPPPPDALERRPDK